MMPPLALPLRIRVDRLTPRLEYTLATVLGEFLGVAHMPVEADAACDLQYVAQPQPGGGRLP